MFMQNHPAPNLRQRTYRGLHSPATQRTHSSHLSVRFCAVAPVTSDIAPQLGHVVLRLQKLQKKEKMFEKWRYFLHAKVTMRHQM